jgi:hypothetical protein
VPLDKVLVWPDVDHTGDVMDDIVAVWVPVAQAVDEYDTVLEHAASDAPTSFVPVPVLSGHAYLKLSSAPLKYPVPTFAQDVAVSA